jgi:hypothetical protein
MERDEAEFAWQRAVTRYRRSQMLHDYIVAGRKMLIAMGPPPAPPPLKVSLGALEWFEELLETPPLDGLDDLLLPGRGGQHGKRRHLRGSSSRQ